ncbi:MAG: ecdysteroid 22-kinase family protein [Desulfobulbaceae bacterium]|nr:ecdysteroid 22-kinase family protein [Desulfobulbaceae bacterium]
MNENFLEIIRRVTGAEKVYKIEDIQTLWSGYGTIMRYGLKGCDKNSVVIKHVKLPDQNNHPRGWNTNLSHQRKIRSYQIETAWYRNWAARCDNSCRIPHSLALESSDDEFLLVLEDLDANGFSVRKNSVSMTEMQACLKWLANFHATFLDKEPTGLWQVGTYWHLETRPDEFEALDDLKLKQAAPQIDKKLRSSPYQTFVHGDAKLANFCFSADGRDVAAVDFQYVGGGCGIKDVAYFIGSCLYEEDCERYEMKLLNWYFTELKKALAKRKLQFDPKDIEHNWRTLYPVAWTDFHRFIKGWSPGHWKINGYSERIAVEVVAQLQNLS